MIMSISLIYSPALCRGFPTVMLKRNHIIFYQKILGTFQYWIYYSIVF